MKKLITIVFAAAFPILAFAGEPSMKFHEIPLEKFSGNKKSEHRVIPYRFFDTMTVVVEDPSACGQKPINPKFLIEKGQIKVTYDLTPKPKDVNTCLLFTQFEITDLPHQALDVAFAGGAEPFTVVKMKKCEFYQPVTSDVYECLVPVINPNK